MDRRWGGLLIMLVILAAVVMPNVLGRSVVGTASIGPIPGPPAVGECLSDPSALGNASVDEVGQALYPSAPIKACSGTRYGEVVAVLRGGMSTKAVVEADNAGVISYDDPNRYSCAGALASSLAPETSTAMWTPGITFAVAPTRPDDLQVGVGQTWIACVAFVIGPDASIVRYSGTLRDSAHSGLSADGAVPYCLTTNYYFVQRAVPCTKSHPVEAFAVMRTADPRVTQQSLDRRCAELIGTLTRMPDPTAAGRLEPQALAIHHASDGTAAPGLLVTDDNGFATCVESSVSQELGGSLVGLGGGDVPWAS